MFALWKLIADKKDLKRFCRFELSSNFELLEGIEKQDGGYTFFELSHMTIVDCATKLNIINLF